MAKKQPTDKIGLAVGASFLIGGFLFFLFLLFGRPGRHTTPPPDPAAIERREAWRAEQQDRQRAKNYVENIKPHTPAR